MTRQERRTLNKRAHAIRRQLTNEDYRTARAAGDGIAWRDIAAVYDGMSAADVIATFDTRQDVAPVVAVVTGRKPTRRKAPAHVARASSAYRLAREAWELGLAAAVAGGRTRAEGGRPARGESYPDEERDYRDSHPAPVYSDFLAAEYAAMRAGMVAA